ncbi:hypothetical protein PF005_g28747 [Phytophthora fragariae]|uniref:Uncharacterized protein n=1 Tax=Phytophthora fragariae TaxID=53985 RepID=A0A6A3FKA0_9STRA|nr:hypothetical protein PF003_g38751 [Phytophthora fragariae]KAE8944787.1 hypothetical protein PF009_g5548 [Phytophthora fragariae]KAE8964559.1 hypothetical protein PF011_g28620 [Phytophthora fragariae]KAE9068670.1 hypothetical protein PF007_g27592 [Phytophthora fragariae]KAE9077440.1 hypothetical protein PF006_g27927 [Phytophthora fragariae]
MSWRSCWWYAKWVLMHGSIADTQQACARAAVSCKKQRKRRFCVASLVVGLGP